MRPAILSLLALCLAAQEPTLVPTLSRVRVHPNQAWITREALWTFPAPGTQRLRLTGLPPGLTLDDVRVQAGAIPGLRLGNVAVIQEESRVEPTAATLALKAESDRLGKALEDLDLRSVALGESLTWLQGLKPDGPPANAGPLPDPKVEVDLARAIQGRAEDLLNQANALKVERRSLIEKQASIRTELEGVEAAGRKNTSVVTLDLDAPSSGQAKIQIQSRTGAARWRPGFEVRLADKSLELLCYASVSQASGEDWKGIGLEISNAEPERALRVPSPPPPVKILYEAPGVILMGSLEGRITDRTGRPVAGVLVEAISEALKIRLSAATDGKGAFRILQLPAAEYRVRATKGGYPSYSSFTRVLSGQATSLGIQLIPSAGGAMVEVVAYSAAADKSDSKTAMNISQETLNALPGTARGMALESTPAHYEESGELSKAWSLDGKRDLPSDAVSRRILLARTSVAPKLRLRAVPRSSTEVFLIAPLLSTSGLPWFPGSPTAVFRNGEQLGQVDLPRLQAGEGALFSFGPVPGLSVQRQRLEATVATAKTGHGRQWTLRERVLLVNDLDQEMEVEVQEPSIRSGSDRIKVEVLPGATPSVQVGEKLTWLIKVPGHGQARIEEAWRITGPSTGSMPEIAALGLPTSD